MACISMEGMGTVRSWHLSVCLALRERRVSGTSGAQMATSQLASFLLYCVIKGQGISRFASRVEEVLA